MNITFPLGVTSELPYFTSSILNVLHIAYRGTFYLFSTVRFLGLFGFMIFVLAMISIISKVFKIVR